MLQAGNVVDGKYKILDRIGQGGMSQVYLAINEKANKTWAIKEVRKDVRENEQIVRGRLLAETELLKRLRHPNLPRIVDVIEEEGSLLIVMDYIEGNSLEVLLREEGAQPQEQVAQWGGQLCQVLGYLHRQKPPIIYRDMKPSNVMLKSDGKVMLIDFGTAREQRVAGEGDDTVCLGTPGYAAPEQWGGCGQTDVRTDIYCLGATLYHLATGCSPSKYLYELPPIRSQNPGLSAGLEEILQKCTRRDPKERYQSCEELFYALEHYPEMDSCYRKKLKRKAGAFFTAAVLALAFGGMGATANAKGHSLAANTWQVWMERGMAGADREEQREAYRQAIRLEPGRAEGYLELLDRVLLVVGEDGVLCFSKEDDRYLRGLLGTEGADGKTWEETLREHREEYDQLAYRLGLAYYYDYEGEGQKSYAVKWLQVAADSPTLPVSFRERAKRLGTIAEYYARLGVADKAGDVGVSYLDYWKDLKELTKGNVAELDNAVTAMRIYRELALQVALRAQEFQKAGVEQVEMEEQLSEIRTHLEQDFTETDWEASGMARMRKELEKLLVVAGEQVEAVYQYQELKRGV